MAESREDNVRELRDKYDDLITKMRAARPGDGSAAALLDSIRRTRSITEELGELSGDLLIGAREAGAKWELIGEAAGMAKDPRLPMHRNNVAREVRKLKERRARRSPA